MSYVSYNKPLLFIANWNLEYGPEIIDFQPKSLKVNLESVAMKIFIAYQNYYQGNEDHPIERMIFKIPFKDINRRARILIDIYSSREGEQPFIVALLVPEYFTDDLLEKFNNLLERISSEFQKLKNYSLKKHYDEIYETFLIEEKVQDADTTIEEDYNIKKALLDFKKGIEAFKSKKLQHAYISLRKAYLGFKKENNLKLLLESTFFLGTVLTQLKKYVAAKDYFEILENLANQLKHEKYHENALYMYGVCAFKVQDYVEAIDKFSTLESQDIQFIDKIKFYYLYGQILSRSNQFQDAIGYLLKALDISKESENTSDLLENKAKLLLEIGHAYYNMAIDMMKSGKIDQEMLKPLLDKSIDYYELSNEIWKDLERFKSQIYIDQLIGNIHEFFGDIDKSLEAYRSALKNAELTNDITARFKIFSKIIQNLVKLNLHQEIVKEIDQMLSKIATYAFIDLYTIAKYHQQIGESLFLLNKNKDALSEFLIALNIYNKFKNPDPSSLKTLESIIKIYRGSNEEKFIDYYQEQFHGIEDKLGELELTKKRKFGLFGEVKEIWIFLKTGIELFTYSPESKTTPQLFGGFLSAMQAFSLELGKDYLKSLTIGDDLYTFYRQEGRPYFILGRSNISSSLKNIEKLLTILYDEFWTLYEPNIMDFDGEISKFKNFFENIKKLGLFYQF